MKNKCGLSVVKSKIENENYWIISWNNTNRMQWIIIFEKDRIIHPL